MLLAPVLRWVGIALLLGAGLAWWLGEKPTRSTLVLFSIVAFGTGDSLRRRALRPTTTLGK